MVISRFEVPKTKLDSKKVAAIVAAIMHCLGEETLPKEGPYIKRKNRTWKELALQEKSLNFLLGR